MLQVGVVGFDIALKDELHNTQGEHWRLLRADVLDIPFEEASFDAVFYYHVIEHVPDPQRSLQEIARVLKPGGGLFVGTPNRSRLIGYVGSRTSFVNKLKWNWKDWKYRLRGRFRNEYGAHAGFTENELRALATPYFREVIFLTGDYLVSKYAQKLPKPILALVLWKPVRTIVAPAVYLWAYK